MNEDSQDLLGALLGSGVRFLVVGAHAMAVHGVPRATGDLDVWVSPEPANAERVWAALRHFGAPVESLTLSIGSREIPFLGQEDLVRNKRASGRAKDVADLEILEGE